MIKEQFVYYVWKDTEINDIIAVKKEDFNENLKKELEKNNYEIKTTVASNELMAVRKLFNKNDFMVNN